MKIKSITTKHDDHISLEKLTILVGPNNSGKSQFLRDIRDKMVAPNTVPTIISKIEFTKPTTFDELVEDLTKRVEPSNPNYFYYSGIGPSLMNNETVGLDKSSIDNYASRADLDYTMGNIAKLRVAFMDAESRLAIAKQVGAASPESPPQNLLQALFLDADAEKKLQEAFFSTFGMRIKLDYSGMVQLVLRVAKEFTEIPPDVRDQYPILRNYGRLDVQGDGYRSFVGIILGCLLANGRIILLDEPEAFLHPTQARALGTFIAEYSRSFTSQIIIATHNANFLYGVMSAGAPVDIFRLNRQGDVTKFHKIDASSTLLLAKSPLLSSQPVLESIFYSGAVVCEGDTDRIFYQTVYNKEYATQDALFVSAHNKQKIRTVVEILRKASVPVCAIVDIDILNSADDLKQLMDTFGVSNVSALLASRSRIATVVEGRTDQDIVNDLILSTSTFLEELRSGGHSPSSAKHALERFTKMLSKWANLKEKGIEMLPPDVRTEANNLIDELKEHGIFVVPIGELESWINVGTRQKNRWIVLALERIDESNYSNELKSFMRCVRGFIRIQTNVNHL